MIDYELAELEAEHLLQSLRVDGRVRSGRRHCALRLACLVAAFEFLVIVIGAVYAL